jgi:hypothetical protein
VRIGGVDVNKPRIRTALAAALALAPAPDGFTVAGFAAAVQRITGPGTCTIRQAAYDLRNLRGKNLAVKTAPHSRRYRVPPQAARTIAALLALRDHIIAPLIADVSAPRPRANRQPTHQSKIDSDYENLRAGMHALFRDLGITTPTPVAAAA